MITKEDTERFRRARDTIIIPGERERSGIGMQKEKTLHAVLKNYKQPDPARQEIPVAGYIADICNEEKKSIVEIQTANMEAMSRKLDAYLPEYSVTIVYPIPHRKWVIWIDPETGELLKRNRSNFIGTWYQMFPELFWIRDRLTDPGLCIEALLIDVEEYRLMDGWGKGGKRGSHRFDTIPLELYDSFTIRTREDLAVLLPDTLPEEFTTRDLENAVGIHRKSVSYSEIMNVMTAAGAARRIGKKGRAWLYARN